ncbi:hypothetical protein V5799_004849 [Amblyomma americanum]|uniref:Uncharacterized protein n=1 Tax=Amblyomma americanum TaxID=6943 RepID=A0AAQ4D4X9_AMBAM
MTEVPQRTLSAGDNLQVDRSGECYEVIAGERRSVLARTEKTVLKFRLIVDDDAVAGLAGIQTRSATTRLSSSTTGDDFFGEYLLDIVANSR